MGGAEQEDMRLVGLITERNLIDVIAPRKVDPYNFSWTPSSLRSVLFGGVDIAEDIMATDLVSVKPADKVGDALIKMKRHHLKRLPIVDHGRLVGEITIKSMIIKFKKVMKWNSVLKEYEVKRSKDG
jgi:CBS domain-containing protein